MSPLAQDTVGAFPIYTGAATQRWRAVKNAEGYSLVNGAYPDKVLASSSSAQGATFVLTSPVSGSVLQKFNLINLNHIEPAGQQVVPDGIYQINSTLSGTPRLDVPGAATTAGTQLSIYAANDTLAQKYHLTFKDGYYQLRPLCSDLCLDVSGGARFPATPAVQSAPTGSSSQQWVIRRNDDGSYTFISKYNGLALDVAGASTANGTKVNLYPSHGGANQKWNITPVTKVESDIATITKRGSWVACANTQASGGSYLRSEYPGSEMRFAVTGSKVSFIGIKCAGHGSFEVYVDEAPIP